MELKTIRKILEEIDIDEKGESINLYFTKKYKENEEVKYQSNRVSLGKSILKNEDGYKDIKDNIKDICINNINTIFDRDRVLYNPMAMFENEIEIFDIEEIGNFSNFIESLKTCNQAIDEINTKEIYFYCIELKNKKNEKVFAIKRFDKMKKLKNGIIGTLVGGEYNKIEGEVMGISEDIDLYIFKNKVFIINHISLERIFDMKTQFENSAKQELGKIKELKIFENFDKFEEDALNNARVVKRLNNIRKNKNSELFYQNFDRVERVIDDIGLNITINKENKKIVYDDKSQLEQLTLLMNDSYYRTLIGNMHGVDKSK